MLLKRLWVRRSVVGVASMAAVVLAACGSASSATGPRVTKTTATFAEGPGAQPNYIFPLVGLQYFSTADLSQFQYLMYRPLYWFGQNGTVALNNSLSLADPPVYSADGKSVTITLKGWKWSDGTQITARDIQFWQNLVTANKENWAGYSPGEYPDNVLSTTINPNNPLQITFNLLPCIRLVLLHLQRAEPDQPTPPARLGQGVGDRSGRQLRRDLGGRAGGLQVPRRAVEEHLDLRQQPALAGGFRAVEAEVDGHRGQRLDGSEPPLRRPHQADPHAVQRSPLYDRRRGVQRAQVRDVTDQHDSRLRLRSV